MKPIIPNREATLKHKWTHQVQWIEQGNPCFVRCKSEHEACLWETKLKEQRLEPSVIIIERLFQ